MSSIATTIASDAPGTRKGWDSEFERIFVRCARRAAGAACAGMRPPPGATARPAARP